MGPAIKLGFSSSLITARLHLVGNSKNSQVHCPMKIRESVNIVGAGASLCLYFLYLGVGVHFVLYIRTY